MLLNLYQFDYHLKEYENRVDAILLERALHKARVGRTNAMTRLAGRCVRLASGLVTTVWRWGRDTFRQVRRTQQRELDGTTEMDVTGLDALSIHKQTN